jgi:two-component system response regulator YesN
MYRVIIADDERIIREGISQKINWKRLNLELVDLAENGKDAYEKIIEKKPDIVITDIKMPGMNGLELIDKVIKNYKNIRFIILSGYDEFEFAKKAMKHGIKHYLLKPTDEDEISKVLKAVKKDIKDEEEKQLFLNEMKNELSTMIPLAKEQFLRDRVLNKVYTKKELKYYKDLFNIKKDVQIILFELDEDYKIEEIFGLERIIQMYGDAFGFFMSSFIKSVLLLLIESENQNKVFEVINEIKKRYFSYYNKDITIAISSPKSFDKIHLLYQEAKEILNYEFYLGKGCIITKKDLVEDKHGRILKDLNFAIEQIVISTKCGNKKAFEEYIERFFEDLKTDKLEKEIIFTYSVDLLTSIIRNNIDSIKKNHKKDVNSYYRDLMNIRNSNTINEIKDKIKKIAIEITEMNYLHFTHKRNRLVQLLLQKVEENIGNENLNLKWLSNNMVFANVDYLSKIFKKEMGINFSQYLIKERMEKAKKLLEDLGDDRIYEIAFQVGFGDNSQYFSQVFKNYTGFSPSDYRKKIEEKTS